MSYRKKKESETWNQYLINIFREGGHVNYVHFLDKYFTPERLAVYEEGLKLEREAKLKKTEEHKEEKIKENSEPKTVFAKKPDRLKKTNKGFLW